MRGILPGKPRATPQAVCTARWNQKRLVVYISGNALVILGRADQLIQTIYHDHVDLLNAVAIDQHTGKLAVHGGGEIHIYKPYGIEEGLLKWSLHISLPVEVVPGLFPTLSWGPEEELLIGSSDLKLYQTSEDAALIWSRKLSSPVAFAQLSADNSLIASASRYDRLVKIWSGRSSGDGNLQFDYSYLPHTSTITALEWRQRQNEEHGTQDILYTLCADGKARIWASTDPHRLQALQLWVEIDLQASIQPGNIHSPEKTPDRHALFIDGPDFKLAIDHAMSNGERGPVLEHLAEFTHKQNDICLVLDGDGPMCAWAFSCVKNKTRSPSDLSNMVYVEDVGISGTRKASVDALPPRFLSFIDVTEDAVQTVIVHSPDGSIDWYEGNVVHIFDPSRKVDRFTRKALLTGHEGSIQKINRTMKGRAILSRTAENESLIWRQAEELEDLTLHKGSLLIARQPIYRSCLLGGGDFVANLHSDYVSLWDTSSLAAKELASCYYQLSGQPLCLINLPASDHPPSFRFLATISSKMTGIVWRARLPPLETVNGASGSLTPSLEQFCTFDLGSEVDLAYVLAVDPAGSVPTVSGFLDTFAKDVALSYTTKGLLSTWAAKVNPDERRVDWLATATVNTGIHEPSLASGSSIRKVALVDSGRNGLSIWDTKGAQLEYERDFAFGESIQDLDWTSTPDEQSILAVGFAHKVMILAQIRYDYLDQRPAWASIREIYIRELTPHPIGDSTWLGSGSLVIGAGNQLFIYDKNVTSNDENVKELSITTRSNASVDIFDIVSLLNGPLPIYHPQLLSQCILAGKLSLVQKVIISLHNELKYYTEGDSLDSSLSIGVEDYFEEAQPQLSKSKILNPQGLDHLDQEPETVTEDLALTLNENLTKKSIPFLSSQEQFHLADLVECVAVAEKHRRSMDENATRFLLFFRRYMLRKSQRLRKPTKGLTWREISWAFHSGSQDILVDLVSRHYQGRMQWEHARDSGMFMWMSDINALRSQFEIVARNEYTKTDQKDPIDCSIYYLALKKKNVLLGLWKMATWHREQRPTIKLLANNFSDSRWKTAALKNAYALMGKRRFEYAAAFFLLAGNVRDAVNICAQQLQDIQLAIAVARVYEGDDSAVLHELLEEKVLPLAAFEGNRWMASWAFWMLGRRDMAVRALITPVYTLLDSPGTPSQEASSYLATDPALVVLYRQLREKTLQGLLGASKVSPKAEWDFVIQIARLYDRMGCDVLALDLVRNWEFLKLPSSRRKKPTSLPDPRRMLRRRSSLVVGDLPSPRSPTAFKSQALKAPPPKVFEEPSANSLLDSFGF